MEKHLHIISLTIPFPVDYGGVYDLFYKLVALHEEGVKIHLHCFEYGDRHPAEELFKYCESVSYYPRKSFIPTLLSGLPFIVASRNNNTLTNNLLKDNYPILMEGIHSTYLLTDKRFTDRKKIVRLHNVEYEYYHDLSLTTASFLKKKFLKREQKLLYRYERKVANEGSEIISVTEKDAITYQSEFGCKNISFMPLFLPSDRTVNSRIGKGLHSLYQGDLSIASNQKAALWLIDEVFAGTKYKLLIAGKNPNKELIASASKRLNVLVLPNPSVDDMNTLIRDAHINILPSYSNTGIKLKLLNALYTGRFCLVNKLTTEGSGVEDLCNFFDDASSCKEQIKILMEQEFEAVEITKRKDLLLSIFNNKNNAELLIDKLGY